MDGLEYQHPDDTRRELKAEWKRQMLGVSRKTAWGRFAEQVGAHYEPARRRKSDRVILDVSPWQLTLDIYHGEKLIFTRLRAPFVSADGLRFKIYRETLFGRIRKTLGMRDIAIGDEAFDDEFIVRSNQPEKMPALLANHTLRALILAQPHLKLEIRDDDGRKGVHYPRDVDSLWFSTWDWIDDFNRLRQIFDLVGETLRQMVTIGAAVESVPGVKL